MKILIKTVNNWEIWYNDSQYALKPYEIKYGDRFDQYYCWASLKGAEKWALAH